MHKTFGKKAPAFYTDRKGAYLIPVNGNLIGVIQTPKGYFLPGGGLEHGEDDETCIHRECLEETGYLVRIVKKISTAEAYMLHPEIGYFHPIQTYYIGKFEKQIQHPIEQDHHFLWIKYEDICGKMYVEMQNWALEQCREWMMPPISEDNKNEG